MASIDEEAKLLVRLVFEYLDEKFKDKIDFNIEVSHKKTHQREPGSWSATSHHWIVVNGKKIRWYVIGGSSRTLSDFEIKDKATKIILDIIKKRKLNAEKKEKERLSSIKQQKEDQQKERINNIEWDKINKYINNKNNDTVITEIDGRRKYIQGNVFTEKRYIVKKEGLVIHLRKEYHDYMKIDFIGATDFTNGDLIIKLLEGLSLLKSDRND